MEASRQRVNRLRWMCRRGMKELDILLEAFLAREAAALDRGAWPQFETLLAAEDDVLWDWVQGRSHPASPDLKAILDAVRN